MMPSNAILTQPAAPEAEYDYAAILGAAERSNWRVEDVIGGERRLDFGRRFLPESLARVEPLTFLLERDRLALNQIRGHGYLYMFGLVEEFILPFVLDQARPQLHGDSPRVRALLRFASEEAKHIDLFRRFRREFESGFGSRCAVIGPPEAIARAVLAHHPLAVALVTLHIEWMTQRHYVDSVKDEGDLDPQFESLLRHHWMEEAQHAKIDTLLVEALAESSRPHEIARAIDEYLEIGVMLDAGLKQQTELDADSLALATGRELGPALRARFVDVQWQANRWTFLGTGMTHPKFLRTVEKIAPGARARLEQIAQAFC
jgi:hypothetical protein